MFKQVRIVEYHHTVRQTEDTVLCIIDREFEFYEFFSFLKFNEFYEFFSVEKKLAKNS